MPAGHRGTKIAEEQKMRVAKNASCSELGDENASCSEHRGSLNSVVKHRHSVYDTLFGMTHVLLLLLVSWKVLDVCRNV